MYVIMQVQVGELLKILTFVGKPHQFGLLRHVFIFDCFVGEAGTGELREAGEYYRFGFLLPLILIVLLGVVGWLAEGIAILGYLVIVCLERCRILRRDRRVLISRDEVCELNPAQALAERFARIRKGNIWLFICVCMSIFNNIHWSMVELLAALLLARILARHFLRNQLLLQGLPLTKLLLLIHQLFHISILIKFQT